MISLIKRLLPVFVLVTFALASCKTSQPSTNNQKDPAPVTQREKADLLPADTQNSNTLLWEISGPGFDTPSYLYGTIHLIGKEDFNMTDLTKNRFDQTDQLVLEIDMDDPAGLFAAAMGVFMKDGQTLESLMTEEDYNRLTSYFSDTLGMDITMFNRMKPIVVSMMMTEGAISGEVVSYETVFMDMASERDMEVLGLETAEFQMSVFDSIPYPEQAQMLVDAMNGQGDSSAEVFEKMINMYKKQDLDGLYNLITEESESIGNYDFLLLDKRNISWIPKIMEMGKEKPSFFAVGAAHLPGEVGVIQLLKNEGYTLTPLKPVSEN